MLGQILFLLINFVFGAFTLLLLARFFMQWQRVPFHNQLGLFVLKTTDWIVRPLRRVVPGLWGLDLASLLPAWLAQVALVAIELALRGVSFGGGVGVVLGLAGMGLIELARMTVYLVFALVLVSAVLSWVAPHAPAAPIVRRLADPFLRPFRRIIPPIAGVDLSPLVLLLLLQILLVVLAGLGGSFMPLIVRGF
ncbi:MAG: YggT family protein [Zoogloeaceae bacterium]|nr:YggT family protein [Zoogloeaceae bacterium]